VDLNSLRPRDLRDLPRKELMEFILKTRESRRTYKSKGSVAKRQIKSTKLDESLVGLSLDDLNLLIGSLEDRQ
jgi:hypothetical protein